MQPSFQKTSEPTSIQVQVAVGGINGNVNSFTKAMPWVLDSGSDTSLISRSFLESQLGFGFKDLKPIGVTTSTSANGLDEQQWLYQLNLKLLLSSGAWFIFPDIIVSVSENAPAEILGFNVISKLNLYISGGKVIEMSVK